MWDGKLWIVSGRASFAGDLQDSKSTSGGVLCVFGPQTLVPMCKRQTSRAESETTCLDAGLKKGGKTTSQLWDCVVDLERRHCQRHSHVHSDDSMSSELIDRVPSHIPDIPCPARLYIFDNNEAVIRPIMEGRSLRLEARFSHPPC